MTDKKVVGVDLTDYEIDVINTALLLLYIQTNTLDGTKETIKVLEDKMAEAKERINRG